MSGAATIEEAAAIAAAIERFLRDTAPAAPIQAQARDEWTRAGMLEGVVRQEQPHAAHPWIDTAAG